MSMRQILQTLLRRATPIMCTTSFFFSDPSELKKPTVDDKLKFEPVDSKKLSNEYMIQQSAIDAANSATQALTVTYMAIIRTSNEYKALLNELIALSQETLQFNVSDKHWDLILELRSKVHTKKEMLNKLTGYAEYVHKMAEAASEISYMSGMDNLSFTLSQRIDDAMKNIREQANYIAKLEQEYSYVQEQCIKNSNKTDSNEAAK